MKLRKNVISLNFFKNGKNTHGNVRCVIALSWVFEYDPETKTGLWNKRRKGKEAHAKKVHLSKLKVKAMTHCFFLFLRDNFALVKQWVLLNTLKYSKSYSHKFWRNSHSCGQKTTRIFTMTMHRLIRRLAHGHFLQNKLQQSSNPPPPHQICTLQLFLIP